MSRKCSICGHPQRDEIDKRLARGDSIAGISRDIAGISEDALGRHKEGHLPEAMVKAHEVKEESRADNLLDELQMARQRTYDLLDKAEEAASVKVYGAPVAYLREIREQIKLLAELEGRLAAQPSVNVSINLLQSHEWILIRSSLMEALQPYREAREAASAALLRIDNRGRNAGR